MNTTPLYRLLPKADWDERLALARAHRTCCRLCPRHCAVNREALEHGFCRSGAEIKMSHSFAHQGEEPPISGSRGSGTLFFSGCTLQCIFCQNHAISQGDAGRLMSVSEVAQRFLELEDQGCHNINWVTPTQWIPWILESLHLAMEQGLSIPVVYNSSGYESLETLALLNGIVDIYLPDMKYASDEVARSLSSAPDYVTHNRAALREMRRQVGVLRLTDDGIATQGLLVRHLVLPDQLAGTSVCLDWLAESLGPETHLSLMAQYRPMHRGMNHPSLRRRLTQEEYRAALQIARDLRMENLWAQEWEELSDAYVFDFS